MADTNDYTLHFIAFVQDENPKNVYCVWISAYQPTHEKNQHIYPATATLQQIENDLLDTNNAVITDTAT